MLRMTPLRRVRHAAVPVVGQAALAAVATTLSLPARPAPLAADRVYVVEIIDPSSTRQAHANGLNDRGDIVGQATYPDGWHAVLWRDGVEIDLGLDAEALAINDWRVAVGVQAERATRWQGGRTRVLDGDVAADINDAGWIVGRRGDAAMRWFGKRSFRMKGLPGSTSDDAVAINEIGEIVGNSQITVDGQSTSHAFFRSLDGRLTELASDVPDPRGSAVRAVNDLGESVGVAFGSVRQPLRWDRHGRATALLEGGYLAHGCQPTAIDDEGWVAGICIAKDDLAVAWDPRGRLVYLNAFLSEQQRAEFWWLSEAYGINQQGWIVGRAYGRGKERPFVMKPVPPTAGP